MNNKPPVSPNTRMMYSPTSQLMQQQQQTILLQPQPQQPQQQQQQQQTSTATFRSLSTNPTLVVRRRLHLFILIFNVRYQRIVQ